MENIFTLNKELDFQKELFFPLYRKDNCLIEKIISAGQITEEDIWLEEDKDEFVVLLQGESEIKYFDGKVFKMKSGDYLLIPANTKHRVNYTSSEPKCIWLAIYIK